MAQAPSTHLGLVDRIRPTANPSHSLLRLRRLFRLPLACSGVTLVLESHAKEKEKKKKNQKKVLLHMSGVLPPASPGLLFLPLRNSTVHASFLAWRECLAGAGV